MVHRVAKKIVIHHHVSARIGFQRESDAALTGVRARLRADFHNAFADSGMVTERGDVLDGVSHALNSVPLRAVVPKTDSSLRSE